MVDECEQFRNAIKRQTGRPDRLTKLGTAINELFEGRISPLQDRFALITGVWEELVPAELRQHCRIAGISGGCLKVIADSPSFASELRWYSRSLLKEIKQRCPKLGIKDIHCVVGQERT